MTKLLVGRAIVSLIGIAVIAVPILLIKGAVGDQVDKATKAVGFENVPANPTDISDDESLYEQGNFEKALDMLKDRTGGDPELLKVGVLPYMAEFQVKDGQKAKGYRYYAKNGEMGEFKVKILGSGSIEGQQFAFDSFGAGITQKLEAAVSERDGSLRVTNMTLERPITGGSPRWSINAESDERTGIVFNAKPDGSGLADPTEFATGGGKAPSTSTGTAQADCVAEANGDVAKIQECVQ